MSRRASAVAMLCTLLACSGSHRVPAAPAPRPAPVVATMPPAHDVPARRRLVPSRRSLREQFVPGGPRRLVLPDGLRVERDRAGWQVASQPLDPDFQWFTDDGTHVRFFFGNAVWEGDGFTAPLHLLTGGPLMDVGRGPGRVVSTTLGHIDGVPTAPLGFVTSVAFSDEETGIALVQPGVVHLTTDGGAHWHACPWGRQYTGVFATSDARYAHHGRPDEVSDEVDEIAGDCSAHTMALANTDAGTRPTPWPRDESDPDDPANDATVHDARLLAELMATRTRGFAGGDRTRVLLYGQGHTAVEDLATGSVIRSTMRETVVTCDFMEPFGPSADARVCRLPAAIGGTASETLTVFVWNRDGVSHEAMNFAPCAGYREQCVADADGSRVACEGRCDPSRACGPDSLVCERRPGGTTVQHAFGDRFEAWEPLGFVGGELVVLHRAPTVRDTALRVGDRPEISLAAALGADPGARPRELVIDGTGRLHAQLFDGEPEHAAGVYVGVLGGAFVRRALPVAGDVVVNWCGTSGATLILRDSEPSWFSAGPDDPWHTRLLARYSGCDAVGTLGNASGGGEIVDGWSANVVDAPNVAVGPESSEVPPADHRPMLACRATGERREGSTRRADDSYDDRVRVHAPGVYPPDEFAHWAAAAERGRPRPVRVDAALARAFESPDWRGILLHGDAAGTVWLLETVSTGSGPLHDAVWQLSPTHAPVRAVSFDSDYRFYAGSGIEFARDGETWVAFTQGTPGAMITHDGSGTFTARDTSQGRWGAPHGVFALDGTAGALTLADRAVVAVGPSGEPRVIAPAFELRACGPHARGDLRFEFVIAGGAVPASDGFAIRFGLENGHTCFRAADGSGLQLVDGGGELEGTFRPEWAMPVRCTLR